MGLLNFTVNISILNMILVLHAQVPLEWSTVGWGEMGRKRGQFKQGKIRVTHTNKILNSNYPK